VVFGDRAPGGRLPVTIYDEGFIEDTSRNITDMSLRDSQGVTYMHYKGTPLWPFGFGLAFTNWSVSIPAKPGVVTTQHVADAYGAYYSASGGLTTTARGAVTTLGVHVSNVGSRASDVVVHVFAALTSTPPRGALARVAGLEAGQSRALDVAITPLALCRVDSDGNQWAEPSSWRLDATADGVTMHSVPLLVTGGRRQVLSWPAQ
jgi:beta-D-xylosidase 4